MLSQLAWSEPVGHLNQRSRIRIGPVFFMHITTRNAQPRRRFHPHSFSLKWPFFIRVRLENSPLPPEFNRRVPGNSFGDCRVGRLRPWIIKWTSRSRWRESWKSWSEDLPVWEILGRLHAIFLPCNAVFVLFLPNTLVQMESIIPGQKKRAPWGGNFH